VTWAVAVRLTLDRVLNTNPAVLTLPLDTDLITLFIDFTDTLKDFE
jgi:hypothetical protein